jgi:hypothetical protein
MDAASQISNPFPVDDADTKNSFGSTYREIIGDQFLKLHRPERVQIQRAIDGEFNRVGLVTFRVHFLAHEYSCGAIFVKTSEKSNGTLSGSAIQTMALDKVQEALERGFDEDWKGWGQVENEAVERWNWGLANRMFARECKGIGQPLMRLYWRAVKNALANRVRASVVGWGVGIPDVLALPVRE